MSRALKFTFCERKTDKCALAVTYSCLQMMQWGYWPAGPYMQCGKCCKGRRRSCCNDHRKVGGEGRSEVFCGITYPQSIRVWFTPQLTYASYTDCGSIGLLAMMSAPGKKTNKERRTAETDRYVSKVVVTLPAKKGDVGDVGDRGRSPPLYPPATPPPTCRTGA